MFNIPMKTSGALSADSLLSLNGTASQGGLPTNNAAPSQQPMNTQQPVQQGFNQPMNTQQPMQQSFNQPMNTQQPMQQSFNQPMNTQQPMQQGFNQPMNTQQPMQQGFNQPMNTQQPMQQSAPAAPRQRPQGSGVHLKKGQKMSLSQINPNLTDIQVCLGWDLLNQACDLDASAFMLGAGDKVVGDDWFVFYGQPTSPDGAIQHMGDSTDGAGAGDDEVINISLTRLDQRVQKITFVVTINEAKEKGQNFSMVQNAYVRVVDKSTGNELVKFMLTDYFANVTSMVVGEVYNKGGQWRFNPVGNGFAHDLAGLCGVYGVNVAD